MTDSTLIDDLKRNHAAMNREESIYSRSIKELDRRKEGIRYWSYCMDVGMREMCPEKVEELCDFLMSLGIAPYSMRRK